MFKHLKTLIAPVLVAFLAASVANGAFYQWSKTAASNGTADASINWAEGMAPSSINDSARAMMARLAEWRDDNSGILGTGGTSTAYTIATNQGLPSTPVDGTTLVVTFHVLNGASPTLQADSGTAYPIFGGSGQAIGAGALVNAAAYRMRFQSNGWYLEGLYGEATARPPIGSVVAYLSASLPSGWLAADGSCVSRTTYATLFTVVGTQFSVCDGSTTFGLPDLRARTIAGLDPGNASGRITSGGSGINGGAFAAAGGSQSQTLITSNLPPYTPAGSVASTGTISSGLLAAGSSNTATTPGSITVGVSLTAITGTASVTGNLSGTPQGGTSSPFATMPPTIILQYMVRAR